MNYRIGAFMLLAGLTAYGSAFDVIYRGHYDLAVGLHDGHLEPHVHAEGAYINGDGPANFVLDQEFEAQDVGMWIRDVHITNSPNGSPFGFSGSYFRIRQNNVSGQHYTGFGAEEIDTADAWDTGDGRVSSIYGSSTGPFIRWQLIDVQSSTGGHYAVWSGLSGVDPVWITSADGITGGDSFYHQAGGHDHANHGFSLAGFYDVTYRVSTVIGGENLSADVTYHFGVGDAYQPVPEPGTLAALGLGLAALRRRRRS